MLPITIIASVVFERGARAEAAPLQDSALLRPMDPAEFRATAAAIERQVADVIVGQHEAVRGGLICLIAGGHALLEGVPGLGKTTLARTFASAVGLSYSRIQFTPDLMPADITGTTVLVEDASGQQRLTFEPGPVFAGLVLADEINRASPRTQSALLEAMQEGHVTIAGITHELPRPFSVLATQNPVELHGTYPLPEAQLDRFMLKLQFAYPSGQELEQIVAVSPHGSEQQATEEVAGAELLLRMNALAHTVPAASHVLAYVARLLLALQPKSPTASAAIRDYVRLGPSPRGGQSLALAGRIAALLDGRPNLALQDIRALAVPALRHRLALSFDAERQGIVPDELISETLRQVPEEAG